MTDDATGIAAGIAVDLREMRSDAALAAQHHTNAALAELVGATVAGARGDVAESAAAHVRAARHNDAARSFLAVVVLSSPNKWTMDRGEPDVDTTDPPSTLPFCVSFGTPFLIIDDPMPALWSVRPNPRSEYGARQRATWRMRVLLGLDAQRARDLAARDEIRAWMRADRTRDRERVLPLP